MPGPKLGEKFPQILNFEDFLQQLKETLKPVSHPHYISLEEAEALAVASPKDQALQRHANLKRELYNRVSTQVVVLRDKMDQKDKDDYKELRELQTTIEKAIKKDPELKTKLIPEEVAAHFVNIKTSIESRNSIAKIKAAALKIAEEKDLPQKMKEEKSNSPNKSVPIMKQLKNKLGMSK
ncbi:hypothetical protein [Candidatus Tisiphia endosymbiont of Nemotelus uliginosus]|uniref:hypothetical protein n=1 Tax=Candidatus Tisiphia endosymbiont of Nemotelus uliginosus TaxID=3077926 RepID=UPI0035C91126